MKKSTIISTIIILLLITIVISLSSLNDQNKYDIRMGYNYNSLGHAPIIVARELGLFEKAGIKVKYSPSDSSKYSIQGLAGGKLDVVSAGSGHFFAPIDKKIPIKLITLYSFSSTYAFVRPNELETLKDLEGKKIATKLGSSSFFALAYLFKQNNLNVSSLELIDLDDSISALALMKHKVIDVALEGSYKQKIFLDSGAVILKEWKDKDYINMYFSRTGIGVNTNFLDENPEVMNKFIDVFIESQRFIKENPVEAAELIAKHINKNSQGAIEYTSKDVEDLMKDIRYNLWTDPSLFVERANFEKEMGELNTNFTLENLFDLKYKEKLEKAQLEIYGNDK